VQNSIGRRKTRAVISEIGKLVYSIEKRIAIRDTAHIKNRPRAVFENNNAGIGLFADQRPRPTPPPREPPPPKLRPPPKPPEERLPPPMLLVERVPLPLEKLLVELVLRLEL
jgi:hypothetical protein